MLKEQKELLAQIGQAHAAALKLYNSGVKISGVVQKLRAAGDELEARVRYIEKQSRPAAPAKPAAPVKPTEPAKPAAKSESQNPKS